MRYTAEDLEPLPTLSTGQTCDLKIDNGCYRVWLSRCGVDDGLPYDNMITEEILVGGRWEVDEEYPG